MNLGGLFSRAPEPVTDEARLRAARLDVARRNSQWTELEEVDLVPRGPRNQWRVSASTDEIYAPHRGAVFQSWSTSVVADHAELAFYVDRDGDLVFLERKPGTWSDHVAKQARRVPA